MSNDKQIAIRDNNTQVSTRYNEADIQAEMGILRAAFPKLDAPPEGLRALIVASKFSGLNPFRGEIYYVPKVGITVASKIKAADAVAWAQAHGNTLNIRFEKLIELHPEWQQVNPGPNDVCWLCIIISSKQRNEYFKWRLQVIDELKVLGYQRAELEAELNKRCGNSAPETRAVGIVRGAEDFGDKYQKATIFSRDDRAQKRALQKALNIGGFAAPDRRNYGGVRIGADEPASEATVESPYRVVESGVSGAADYDYDESRETGEPIPGTSFAEHIARATPEQPATVQTMPAQSEQIVNEPPAPKVYKPVSDADRAVVSALLDRLPAIEALAPNKDDKPAVADAVAKMKAFLREVNEQLEKRGEIQIVANNVGDAKLKMKAGVMMLMDYDKQSPRIHPSEPTETAGAQQALIDVPASAPATVHFPPTEPAQ